MATDTKIVEKIQKLFALSGSSNPHEAAVALSKMQKLLLQHNLTMAQIERETKTKSPYVREFFSLDKKDEWRRTLMRIIADHTFCKALFVRKRGYNTIVLIGEKENIEITRMMFSFIAPQLEKMCKKFHKEYDGPLHGNAWRYNFYVGANRVISERLTQEQREFEASGNDCKALIVVKERDLKEAVDGYYKKLRNYSPKHTFRGADGYEQGKIAGEQVRFRKEIQK